MPIRKSIHRIKKNKPLYFFTYKVCICNCGKQMEMRYLEDGSELGDFEGPIYIIKCPVCNEVWELEDACENHECHLKQVIKQALK